jgi:hypothetical protein
MPISVLMLSGAVIDVDRTLAFVTAAPWELALHVLGVDSIANVSYYYIDTCFNAIFSLVITAKKLLFLVSH